MIINNTAPWPFFKLTSSPLELVPTRAIELTLGERGLLQRALRIYMNHYQQLVGAEKHATSKADLKNHVSAAQDLFNKIVAVDRQVQP